MGIKFDGAKAEKRTVGQRLVAAAKEAVEIARGEASPAVVHSAGGRGPKKGFGGRPRKGEEAKTLLALRPWEAETPPLSRSTWYKRRRERGE